MNNAPKLENCDIILRQPIKEDIIARKNLGLNMEWIGCVVVVFQSQMSLP